MEYSYSVVVPRCDTCLGRFYPKSKVLCSKCDCKIHYDCAVYADDDCNDMLCITCFKNEKIRKGLEKDGIFVKVEGDDLCRVYKGKAFWGDDEEQHIHITDEECELEIDDIPDDDACIYCGWKSEFPESHIEYGNFKCEYITDRYKLKLDDIGDIVWENKCAFGYCEEELYNRGCLPDWENMWLCEVCNKYKMECLGKRKVCGRKISGGDICDEYATYGYEYCKDCMEQELGMN